MQITPENRKAWRRWLENHHATNTEVWLVILKKHTEKPNLSYDDAVEEALCFGWIDGIRRSLDDDRYMHRFTPRRANSRWSPSNRRRVEALMASGQMTKAGLKAVDAAKQNGQWATAATSRPDYSMPRELREALKKNRKAGKFFKLLAPSYQRQYVAWIASARRAETRKRRIGEAMTMLERGQRLGMR